MKNKFEYNQPSLEIIEINTNEILSTSGFGATWAGDETTEWDYKKA